MPDDFGTPKASDATAMHEKTVQEAAEYAVGLDEVVKDEVLNRPLGSQKVPMQDQLAEYRIYRQMAEEGDPKPLAKFFVDNESTVEQSIQFSKNMEERLGSV